MSTDFIYILQGYLTGTGATYGGLSASEGTLKDMGK